jgi:hypothetical protein
MANKEKFTVEQVEAALRASKGLVSTAARALGCDPETVRRYIKRYRRLEKIRDEERATLVDTAESVLEECVIDKQGWAVSLVLKTLGKDRGYTERIETLDVTKLTDEELKALTRA